MNTTILKDRLIQKINTLSFEQLSSVLSFVDELQNPLEDWEKMQPPRTPEERKILVGKLRELFRETQEQFKDNPITEAEIQAEIDAYRGGQTMTIQESRAMEKWEYLLKHHQRLNDEPLSNEEIEMVRNVLHRQGKNRPTGLAKEEIFIADDFDAPLPDDVLDLFYCSEI